MSSDTFDDFGYDDYEFDSIKELECMRGHMDGAKWGVSDWYEKIEEGIKAALEQGPSAEWTTGWYGSKKEIASGRITCKGGKLICEAGVSDDFDTEGRGRVIIDHTTDLDKVRAAVDEALDAAGEDKRDNEDYLGFSIHHIEPLKYTDYSESPPVEKTRMAEQWVETYIRQHNDGYMMDEPPGDNYHQWGWQEDHDVPKHVKDALEQWIMNWPTGESNEQFTYEGWTVKPWRDD